MNFLTILLGVSLFVNCIVFRCWLHQRLKKRFAKTFDDKEFERVQNKCELWFIGILVVISTVGEWFFPSTLSGWWTTVERGYVVAVLFGGFFGLWMLTDVVAGAIVWLDS